jgi:hypothetical protein
MTKSVKEFIEINSGGGFMPGMLYTIMGMCNCGKSIYVTKEMSEKERNDRYEKAKKQAQKNLYR